MNEESTKSGLLQDTNLHLIFTVTLFAVMGVASIAPAFPKIIEFFHITKSQVGLLVTAFTLPGIFLSFFMGILADRFGRKNILVPSIFLFGIAGFLCMFSKSFHVLLVFRFIQGIGAASLGSINITLIGDLYQGNRRITAMGYNASVLSIGTALYPSIGGSLALIGWNFPFLLPLLAIPLGLVIAMKLKNPEPKNRIYLFTYLNNVWNRINQKTVWGLLVLNVLVFFLIYGALITYFPLMMKERMGSNSFIIGITISLMSFTTAFTSTQLGKISQRIQKRSILLISSGLYAASMVIIAQAHSFYLIIIPLLLFGMGQGLLMPTIQTMLVGFAPLEERAVFMSINSMVLRTGQTLAPLVMSLFFKYGGFTFTYLGGTLIAVAMIFTILFLVKEKPV